MSRQTRTSRIALALVGAVALVALPGTSAQAAADVNVVNDRVITVLNKLSPKVKESTIVSTALKTATRAGGSARSARSNGKLIGFDITAGKSKACVFQNPGTRLWDSVPSTCKSYFFGTRSPAMQQKSEELGKIGAGILVRAMSLAEARGTEVSAVIDEVVKATALPSDVVCEVYSTTLVLTSTLFPSVRANIALKR